MTKPNQINSETYHANTTMETNPSIAQANLFIITVQTITQDAKTQQTVDKTLIATDVTHTCKTKHYQTSPPHYSNPPAQVPCWQLSP